VSHPGVMVAAMLGEASGALGYYVLDSFRSTAHSPEVPDDTPSPKPSRSSGPSQPPGDRAVILACSVRRLRRWWLEVQCPCRVIHIPLRMMAANRELAGQSIADVLVQLRCEKCGQKPVRVALEEDPAATSPHRMGAYGWQVVLIE
jgi:hypothetical protein